MHGAVRLLVLSALLPVVFACNALLGTEAGTAPPSDGGAVASAEGTSDGSSGKTGGAFEVVRFGEAEPNLHAVWGTKDMVYAVGEQGTILRFDGNTWEKAFALGNTIFVAITGVSSTEQIAVGFNEKSGIGAIVTFDGISWHLEKEVPDPLFSVWMSATEHAAVVAGQKGKIYKKTAAKDWYSLITLEPNPYIPFYETSPAITGIAGVSSKELVLAGEQDTVFRGSNSVWTPYYDAEDRSRSFWSVWAFPFGNESPRYLVGGNYYGLWMWGFDGSGATYTIQEDREVENGEKLAVNSIFGFSSQQIIFVGDKGAIFTWDASGAPPKRWPSPTEENLTGVWGSSPNDIWIVGTRGTILHGSFPL